MRTTQSGAALPDRPAMRTTIALSLSFTLLTTIAPAQRPSPASVTAKYIYGKNSPVKVLQHIRIIDGTGAAVLQDQTVIIEGGKITRIGRDLASPANAEILDLSGYTVLPGLVGMHDHIYYLQRPNADAAGSEPPTLLPQMTFSAPRMYLANGVTTIRTAGSVEPYADINLRHLIDAGTLIGPHVEPTAPYLQGPSDIFMQMHVLTGPDDATAFVNFWAAAGSTNFKAYMHITRAELGAAIKAAHALHLKVTGHLCSVTYPEAAELGIDNLEHGFFVNTQLDDDKQPDQCSRGTGSATLAKMTPDSPEADALIKLLVVHHVAITSTLPVFEANLAGKPVLRTKALATLTPQALEAYLYNRNRRNTSSDSPALERGASNYKNDAQLEHKFVEAGGFLMAGLDPTGNGATLPGFGDQHEVELLVSDAGFKPLEAIKIATLNGAIYLGLQNHIGSVEVGKDADLMIVRGDPSTHITDIENVEIVLKDGTAYDSNRLLESVKGRYGQY
jgi:imidazolonepropionase-like amidohydrolase